jgi:deoxycytidylate deaminase
MMVGEVPMSVSYSGKNQRFMEIAKRTALKSGYKRFRHGAVLVKGGSVRNASANSGDYCSFGARFRHHQGKATVHAELGAILGLDRSVTEGSTVYVARINKQENYRLSKPCPMCEAALRHVGVKKVVYSVNNQEVGSIKL